MDEGTGHTLFMFHQVCRDQSPRNQFLADARPRVLFARVFAVRVLAARRVVLTGVTLRGRQMFLEEAFVLLDRLRLFGRGLKVFVRVRVL